MTRKYFCVAAAALVAAVLAVTMGFAGAHSPGAAAAAPAAVDGDAQTPPPPAGVAPADPSADAPDAPEADHWRCPHCGAMCAGPMGRPRGAGPGKGLGGGSFRERPFGDRAGWGRGDGHGPGGPHGIAAERMIRHSDDLKLTDKQIETLEKLSSNSKKALVDLHAQIAKEEIEIQDLLRSGSDDLAAVKRHADALSKARSAVFEERISNFLEARKVLTADQKKLVKETFPRIGSMLD